MLFSSTVEFYQDGRTYIRKKLPEDTLTNASIDISFLADYQPSLGKYWGATSFTQC